MNICLCLENKDVLLCHILRCLNVLYVIKRHIEEFGYRYYGTVPQSLCRKYRRSDSRGRYKDCRF